MVCLTITLDPGTVIRLVNNHEDITLGGEVYIAFPFEFGGLTEDIQGDIPVITIRVANPSRVMQAYISTYNGAVGLPVTVQIVSSEDLAADYTNLTWNFIIIETSYDEQWVTFQLSSVNALLQNFPPESYMANFCSWTYGSIECGHTGNECRRTLNSCRARANSANFGGFKGLDGSGLRIV